MALPDSIQQLNNEILEAIRNNALHQSSIASRKHLYDAVEAQGLPISKFFRARLVIMTARRVLPIFEVSLKAQIEMEKDFEEDFLPLLTVPKDLLDETEAITFQQGDPDKIQTLQISIYNAVLVRYSALYAMLAAYKASHETIKDYEFIKNYFFPQNETITDADYGKAILSDTASSAAMAEACNPTSYHFNVNKLLAFWEWWHTEAIPSAWETALKDIGK